MGLFRKLAGTIGSFLQIDGPSGPAFKDNAGVIEARNAGDTAFVKLRADASVANFAALPAANTMPEGYVVEVLSRRSLYLAFPTTNTWFRLSTTGAWATQTAWFVNNATGSDDNDGSTALTALKTWAEFVARVGMMPKITTSTTIQILTSNPESDPIVWRPIIEGCLVTVKGTRTVLLSSTFTGVTVRAPATNTPLTITDAATASFAAYVGKQMIDKTGANVGSFASIAKAPAANQARLNAFLFPSPTLTYDAAEKIPVNGDAYDIFDVTAVGAVDIIASGTGEFFSHQGLIVQDLDIGKNTTGDVSNLIRGDGVVVGIISCVQSNTSAIISIEGMGGNSFVGVIGGAYMSAFQTNFGGVNGCTVSLRCLLLNGFTNAGGNVNLNAGFLAQAQKLATNPGESGGAFIGVIDAGFMDWTAGPALDLQAGACAEMYSTAKMWGTSAVANSITLRVGHSGARFTYLAGTLNNLTCQGAGTGGADIQIGNYTTGPALDVPGSGGAANFTYTAAARVYSLANLKATFAAGGFGVPGAGTGTIIDPRYGGGISPAN